MAFKALTGMVPEWFEPERWELTENGELKEIVPEDESDLVKFEITPLNGGQFYEALRVPSASSKLACVYGVTGWDNFKDANGRKVEFNREKILEYIPPMYIAVIGAKVIAVSSIDGKQAKN